MSNAASTITIELNPREQRLYDTLRERVVVKEPGSGSGFGDVALLLPDLTVLLVRMLRDRRVPRGPKLVALLGVGYVLSPVDLLPSLLLGPVGLVDDLLVVSAALSRLLNHVHPDVVRDAWPGQGDALEAIQRVSRWSEGVFRGRLRRSDAS
ncbi:MAG: YkvA family protein [Myxococcota bacterium]